VNLSRLVATVVTSGTLGCLAQSAPTPQASINFPDGTRLVAGYTPYPTGASSGYALAVSKYRPDGSRDPSFNGNGMATIPIFGYYEGAGDLVQQPDKKLLVLGYATDPTDPSLHDTTPPCHPAFCGVFPVIVRLDASGSLDYTFHRGGKLVLDYPAADAYLTIGLDDDNHIVLFDGSSQVGSIAPDGSIDAQPTNAPSRVQLKAYPYLQAQGLWREATSDLDAAGLAVSQQGDVIFAARTQPDEDGALRWQSVTLLRTGRGTYKGTAYATSGPPAGKRPSLQGGVTATAVGEATLKFEDGLNVLLDWPGVSGTRTFRAISPPPLGCAFGALDDLSRATNLTDFWYPAPPGSQTGWGVHLAHGRDDTVSVTWFTYDEARRPIAFHGEIDSLGAYAGYGGQTDAGSAGDAHINFEAYDGNLLEFNFQARLRFARSEALGSEALTRMVYATPGTACR
jgi:hypothetical protein